MYNTRGAQGQYLLLSTFPYIVIMSKNQILNFYVHMRLQTITQVTYAQLRAMVWRRYGLQPIILVFVLYLELYKVCDVFNKLDKSTSKHCWNAK